MPSDDLSRWDVIRHRLKTRPARDVFIEFANICSKNFMEEEHEEWVRFADGENTEGSFHQEIVDMFCRNERAAVEVSREHMKTSLVLQFILYHVWKHDNFNVIYFSATQSQAKDKLAELQTIYRRNKDWLNLEESDEQWSKFHKQFDNGSSIKAEGWGTAVEGAHVQLIVLDDILQERGAMTDEEVWNFYSQIVSPMVTESGKIILVGTKKRRGDIFDEIENNLEWVHAKYPSTPDNVIFPEKWPKARLQQKKREIGSRAFNREFGLEVIIEDDVLMPPSWNKKNRDSDVSYPESWKQGFNVCGFDPAISPTGDYAAFFAMSMKDSGDRQILHASRQKGMSLNDMMMKLQTLDTKYNFQKIVIEQNSFQRLIVDEAIQNTSLPVQGHTTGKSKSDPANGIPRIAVMFENGKYLYPYKENEDVEKTDMVIESLNSLKYEEGKITNNHTPDIVMAKFLAEQGILDYEQNNKALTEPFVVGVKGGI